jgi:uncharacterized membrane protein
MDVNKEKNKKVALFMLGASVTVMLIASIFSGIAQDFFRCAIFLACGIICSVYFAAILLGKKIDDRFNKLEEIINKKCHQSKEPCDSHGSQEEVDI